MCVEWDTLSLTKNLILQLIINYSVHLLKAIDGFDYSKRCISTYKHHR